jgi:cytochrome c553
MFAMAAVAEPDDESLIETGRRIYEDGVMPDGKPLLAMRTEGFVMEGRYAACVSCHRRSGMGSVEGNIDSTVLVPPVAGPVLFAASRFAYSELDKGHHYIPNDAWERVLTRTAYDRQSLARSLREGIDPDGNKLVAPMPLYNLDDSAVAALSAYLEPLSSTPAPGVEPDILHLATVVTPDAKPAQADAVVDVLRAWSESARAPGKPWHLHVWMLSGASETWQAQLEQHYRQQPVFALLSGAGGANWAPVHEFCEQQRLACVLPSVEIAPDPGDDWYSMYFSPGLGLEARILAKYLANAPTSTGNIIQVYSGASGRHAAKTLRSGMGSFTGSINDRRFRLTSPRSALKEIWKPCYPRVRRQTVSSFPLYSPHRKRFH